MVFSRIVQCDLFPGLARKVALRSEHQMTAPALERSIPQEAGATATGQGSARHL